MDIEKMSYDFHQAGGIFFVEVLANGKVHLFACLMKGDEPVEVETMESDNGPPLLDAVDELVRRAITHVGAA